MAGLLAGAMAGALKGGGEAVQKNAQVDLEEKRAATLADINHRYAMERQDDTQTYTTKEREAGEVFKREQNELDRQALAQRRLSDAGKPTAAMREASWLVEQGIAPDLNSAYDTVTSGTGRGQDQLNYLQDRISTIQELRGTNEWFDMPEDQQSEYLSELEDLQETRRRVETQAYPRSGRGGSAVPQTGGVPSQQGGTAADNYIQRFIR